MNKTRISVCTAVVAIALVATGCGGDDESSSESSLTKDEFITQADQVCADANEELRANPPVFESGQPTEEELTTYVDETLVPSLQSQHDGIEALGTPEGDEGETAELVDALQAAIDTIDEDPLALATSAPFDDVNGIAKAYGLKECGSG